MKQYVLFANNFQNALEMIAYCKKTIPAFAAYLVFVSVHEDVCVCVRVCGCVYVCVCALCIQFGFI